MDLSVLDASNAWQEENYQDALQIAERLIGRTPGRADYRLLAARAAAKMERWVEADERARWLLAQESAGPSVGKVEPWQREWAGIVHGEVLLHTGQVDEGRRILGQVRDIAGSPHARAAAERMLEAK